MDPRRFDSLTRSLATPKTRRGLLGGLAALGAVLLGGRAAEAQVTQAQCGNKVCYNRATNAVDVACAPGCVCCVYGNGNSRCRPPQECSGTPTCPPGQVLGPSGTCAAPTTTTTSTTTTTTTTTTAPPTTTTTTTPCPACGACIGPCPADCICTLDHGATAAAGASRFSCAMFPFSGSFQDCDDVTFCPDGEICTGGQVCRTACPAGA